VQAAAKASRMERHASALLPASDRHAPLAARPDRDPDKYGFMPQKLSASRNTFPATGEPIVVLVANIRLILPMTVIRLRPVRVMNMDGDGGRDEKITAVCAM
jgi:inorganic pyrophosphatase